MSLASNHPAYAVIVAGGSGQRMQSGIPKQFMELRSRPVLYYSIQAFLHALPDIHLILVLSQEMMGRGEELVRHYFPESGIKLVVGGKTRFESVAAGLRLVNIPSICLVHDGARPLVTPDLIRNCYESARNQGNGIPVIPVTDSIRQVSGFTSRSISRDDLRIIQTPQAFQSTELIAAFRQPYMPTFTDEASVVEWAGGTIHLVEGAKSNIKITTPEDLVIAAALLQVMEA